MARRERRNLVAVVAVVMALAAVSPALAAEPGPSAHWMARLLGWLGLEPQKIGLVWDATSAHIDPNGQPRPNGASETPDDSAHIDPNGRPQSNGVAEGLDDSANIDPNG